MTGQRARTAGIYYPGLQPFGGAERVAIELARALADDDWSVTMYTTGAGTARMSDAYGRDAPLAGVRVVSLADTATSDWAPAELARLALTARHAHVIRAAEHDLMITAKYKSTLPGCGKRNIYYAHFPQELNVPVKGTMHRAYMSTCAAIERHLVARSPNGFLDTYDEVWANSLFTAEHVRTRWHRAATLMPPPCSPVAPAQKKRVIAVVGRFQPPAPHTPYKAQDVLVRAFAAMDELHEGGWRLVLTGAAGAGDARYLDSLRVYAADAPVTFLPNASRADVEALLGSASIYWHAQGYGADAKAAPQTQEHFGISVVEAMSAGAIPLVYGDAGPAEIVAPLGSGHRWADIEQLQALTHRWATADGHTLAKARTAAQDRATSFSPTAFQARLRELMANTDHRNTR